LKTEVIVQPQLKHIETIVCGSIEYSTPVNNVQTCNQKKFVSIVPENNKQLSPSSAPNRSPTSPFFILLTAENAEKTSGAPLPNANSVTPCCNVRKKHINELYMEQGYNTLINCFLKTHLNLFKLCHNHIIEVKHTDNTSRM